MPNFQLADFHFPVEVRDPLLGQKVGMIRETNELFLPGLLSIMDARLNVPMAVVLQDIQVD